MYTVVMNTYETQYTIFNWATIAVSALTALVMLGIFASAPTYLGYLRAAIQVYVGLFLLYRFHPFSSVKAKFSELDRQVAFSAGAFITMATILGATLQRFAETATSDAKAHIPIAFR